MSWFWKGLLGGILALGLGCKTCPKPPVQVPVGPVAATLVNPRIRANWPARAECPTGSNVTLCFADAEGKEVIQYLLDLEAWAKAACELHCKKKEQP